MFTFSIINDLDIPVPDNDNNLLPFPNQQKLVGNIKYPQFLITGGKGRGKTYIASLIIKILLTSKTKVVIFSSTFARGEDKDKFKEYQEKYPDMFQIYSRLTNKDGSILDKVLNDAKERYLKFNSDEYKKKLKHCFPNYIFLFDDLEEIRDEQLSLLWRTTRHINSCAIFIQHRFNMTNPIITDNSDIVILTAGISSGNLKSLYDRVGLNLTKKEFLKAYNMCTEKGYDFMFINLVAKEIKKNFKELLNIYDN